MKDCQSCKYEDADAHRYPCNACNNLMVASVIGKWEPKTNYDLLVNLSRDKLAYFLATASGKWDENWWEVWLDEKT